MEPDITEIRLEQLGAMLAWANSRCDRASCEGLVHLPLSLAAWRAGECTAVLLARLPRPGVLDVHLLMGEANDAAWLEQQMLGHLLHKMRTRPTHQLRLRINGEPVADGRWPAATWPGPIPAREQDAA